MKTIFVTITRPVLACILIAAISTVSPGCVLSTLTTRPTVQENQDYCDGQLNLCKVNCSSEATYPTTYDDSNFCTRECKRDHIRCLRTKTQ